MQTTKNAVTVTRHHTLLDGKNLYVFTLQNNSVEIKITNFGCIILSIRTPDKNGIIKNIVAGFKTIGEYKNNSEYFGCVIGRYANRIANGTFTIDDKIYHLPLNDGVNSLHGGVVGFDKKIWNVQEIISNEIEAGVVFSYRSKDGEESFPGTLTVSVSYVLHQTNELVIQYKAVTDKATPVNLTNHSYFNLTGFKSNSVLNHWLTVYSNAYTEKNEYNQPTGKIINVANSAFDFRAAKKIGTDISNDTLKNDSGYDHNFIVKHSHSDLLVRAATLCDEETGRQLDVFTTAPGIQIYTANFFDGSICGAQNTNYKKHSAIALETQSFPDSPNHPHFPNTILRPGEEYNSTTKYAFGIINE